MPILLFPGVSGKGKTFSATTVPDGTIRELCGVGLEEATVLGLYTLRPSCGGEVSDWAADQVCKRPSVAEHCKHPGDFGKVSVHVVIDEVGSSPQFVRTLVENARDAAENKVAMDIEARVHAKLSV